MDLLRAALRHLLSDFAWAEIIILSCIWAGLRFQLRGRHAAVLQFLCQFAARPVAPYISLMIAAVLPRLLLLLWLPPSEPYIEDEFSHRFLADTLLLGRLANPTHPLWEHFETTHIFHQPTYSSMYLPGQALFLAAGKLLTGWHWAGVLGGAMAATSSLLWMLRALFPPQWAYLGAAFYACRVAMFSVWTEGYWGGHVAAAAGALLIGSAVRIRRQPDAWHGFLFGCASVWLAWTRPFEGFLLFCSTCFFLAAGFYHSEVKRKWLKLVALPAGTVLLIGAFMTAFYCYRVTGSPLKLPYSVNQELYGWPMTLPWMKPRPVYHRHKEHALYYSFELSEHENITNPAKIPQAVTFKLYTLFNFFLGPLLGWPLLTRRWTSLQLPENRLLFSAGGAVLGGAMIEQTVFPHYVAPASPVLYALLTGAWKSVHDRPRLFASALLFASLLPVVFLCRATGLPMSLVWKGNSWCDPLRQGNIRARIQRQMEETPGRHVAIVRYNRSSFSPSWVFNSPDIDSQRVIWAQDMGERNRELLEYYPDRTFWIIEPDARPPRATIWKKRQ